MNTAVTERIHAAGGLEAAVAERYGPGAIRSLPGVRGPAVPLMIDAPTLERLDAALAWACAPDPADPGSIEHDPAPLAPGLSPTGGRLVPLLPAAADFDPDGQAPVDPASPPPDPESPKASPGPEGGFRPAAASAPPVTAPQGAVRPRLTALTDPMIPPGIERAQARSPIRADQAQVASGVAPAVTPAVAPGVTPAVAPGVAPAVAPGVTPAVAPGVAPVRRPAASLPDAGAASIPARVEGAGVVLRDRLEAVAVPVRDPGLSGKNFLPVKNAYDAAQKEASGAPMVVLWQHPQTDTCRFAVVRVTDAEAIRRSSFRCERVCGGGAVVLSYEEGKLGAPDGPAVRFLGQAPAAPRHFLEGRAVAPAVHARGRAGAVPGAALARAIVARAEGGPPAGFAPPSGRTAVSLGALDEEFAAAAAELARWNRVHEPRLREDARRGGMASAAAAIRGAMAEVSLARAHISEMREAGVEAVRADFSAYPEHAEGFVARFAADLGAEAALLRERALERRGREAAGAAAARSSRA